MLTVGELSTLCANIMKEYGADKPVCIQIKTENNELIDGSYVHDEWVNNAGCLYLIGRKY